MNLGEKIRKIRKREGLSQIEVAEKSKISVNSLRLYESNQRQPRVETLKNIAGALGVPVSDFLPDDIYPTNKEVEAMKQAAASIEDGRKAEIEEKRLSNLISHKAKQLNNAGKQKLVDHADLLIGNPDYKKDKNA